MNAPSQGKSSLPQAALRALLVALVYGFLAWTGIQFSRTDGQVAPIWLANAVIVAIGFVWGAPLVRLLPPVFIAHVILLTFFRQSSVIGAVSLAMANCVEIGVVVFLARRAVPRVDRIKDPRGLTRFLAIASLAAMLSGLIASVAIGGVTARAPLILWQWWLAHGMAMMTVAPVLLVIEAERLDCRRRGAPLVPPSAWPEMMLGAAAMVAIFAQTSYPLLFLAVPVIFAVAVRRGIAASAVLLLITALIATQFTMAGQGPINLVTGDMHLKAGILQIFLFATFASTLPISLAAERIEALRERMLTLFETMNEIPFTLDLAGRWTFVSRHWSALFDGRQPLPIGKRALAIVPPERRRALLKAMVSLARGETEEVHLEFIAHRPTPQPVHLSLRMKLLRARDGSPEGFGGLITDMSREVASQQALAASEARLLSLAENAPVGIFQFDNEANATFLNQEWARMHGMTVEEGLGKGWQRILDAEQFERYAAYAQEREAGETTDIETVVRRPDGRVCHIRVVTTALFDSHGAPAGRMGVVVDQSREEEAKAALLSALEDAKSSATAKDRFLALMSHELRTPMNGVLGFAERLQETGLDENQRRYVSLITQSGEIMLSLLNDILDTSRMRAGQVSLTRAPYDLSATITSICQHFEPLAAKRSLQLRCTFASPLPKQVMGDRQRVTQILNNLIGNALKFTEVGWISIYARIELQYERTILILEVTDTGIGIPPDVSERIFEAFDQGSEDTAMRFGGTGLGLPIARGMAEQMGGSLQLVTSNPGKGSIFRLTLPLEIPSETAPARTRSTENAKTAVAARPLYDLNILVAEDNEINRHLITELLSDYRCRLTMVNDGREAVEAVQREMAAGAPFDLALLDLRMPVLDGIGATKAIRDLGIDAVTLPIIAVTASVHQDAMDACWQAGMQDYVPKPLTRAAIERVFEKWGNPDRLKANGPANRAEPADGGLDPAMAELLPRFQEQCHDCLKAVTAALDAWPDIPADEARLAQSMVHSVAGLAAPFAATQLIVPAQQLDHGLDTPDSPRTWQLLADMRDLLKAYLAPQQ